MVLDLSALYGSDALGPLMLSGTAWLRATLRSRAAEVRTIVVIDEAWKLSRQYGVSNVAVLHCASDLHAAGAGNSEQVALAQGLLADSETRVINGQPPDETTRARELLGLTDVETEVLPVLGGGVALWRVGSRSFLIEHVLGDNERQLVDTDARMA